MTNSTTTLAAAWIHQARRLIQALAMARRQRRARPTPCVALTWLLQACCILGGHHFYCDFWSFMFPLFLLALGREYGPGLDMTDIYAVRGQEFRTCSVDILTNNQQNV